MTARELHSCVGIPIAWHKARNPDFPRKSIWFGASSLFGRGTESLEICLDVKQPQGCTGASLGCSRARDNFETFQPSPAKTTCSFPYQFSGEIRNSGCNLLGPLQGSFGPFGPEIPKKSRKNSRGLSATGSKKVDEERLRKVEKRSKRSQKRPFFPTFSTFFRLFSPFFDPEVERPWQFFFSDFFGVSGPKGPNAPCKGPRRL